MKKLILILSLVWATTAHSQTEVSIDPIGLLLNNVYLQAEQGLAPDFSVAAFGSYSWNMLFSGYSNYSLGTIAKYYLAPSEKTLDKFYIGAYLRYHLIQGYDKNEFQNTPDLYVSDESFVFGFALGRKWISRQNITIELGTGFGRRLFGSGVTQFSDYGDFDYILNFKLGYRFK
jgi:hypothetical protein